MKKNICLVVLGDIGRSPRMQYHALSLAEHGHKVDIVGYGESEPHDGIKSEPLVNYHYLAPYPSIPIPRTLNYIFKTIWQTVTLFFLLLILRKPDAILVQNPPAIPSLLVCWIFSIIVWADLIIDWHNYAFTIMSLSVGPNNILVKLTKQVERLIGQRATANFCVTNAMKNDLHNWSIRATTLYDRAPEIFQPLSIKEQHEILLKVSLQHKELADERGTLFTTVDEKGNALLKTERPGLLISSTSWTEDEDFFILLQALQDYESNCETKNLELPPLICIITGKGPLKEFYCQKITTYNWKHIKVLTPWLESADYPRLLACADLGVCLHTSSSGYDLPMKVVDMFGCGIPTCAYDFKCLNELVQNGINSYTFKTAEELSQQLQEWFKKFPNNTERNVRETQFKKALEIFQTQRWRENWNEIAMPYFT